MQLAPKLVVTLLGSLWYLLSASVFAQCELSWTTFESGGLSSASDEVVWDPDGAGPAQPVLIVGGSFYSVGGVQANKIASWSGAEWLPLALGVSNDVNCLAVFDEDGSGPEQAALFVGGNFTTAGGVPTSYIARWNGDTWSSVGGGVNSNVYSMAVVDLDGPGPNPEVLYVGGFFSSAGGVAANHLATWNGSSWAPVPIGPDGGVGAIAIYNDGSGDAVYVAGGFTTVGTLTVNHIARWSGNSWSAVGTGITGIPNNTVVDALCPFDEDGPGGNPPSLYVGGAFQQAGGIPANNIARLTGASWSALGSGITGGSEHVAELFVHDDDGPGPHADALYVGGNFLTAGQVPASGIAKWNGSSWSALGNGTQGGGNSGTVSALASFDPDAEGPSLPLLYAGGNFTSVGFISCDGFGLWNGHDWVPVGSAVNADVDALTLFDDDDAGPHAPSLYAGGDFTAAGLHLASRIARFDGTTWSALGPGLNGLVEALVVYDSDGDGGAAPVLVASGAFTGSGAQGLLRIAKWNGSTWSGFSSGMANGSEVKCLAVWDQDASGPLNEMLYAGGNFTLAGGISANRIAKWNGSNWSPLGSGLNNPVNSIVVFDADSDGPGPEELYVGGSFTSAGGSPAVGVAKWNGSSWSPVGGGLTGTVNALIVFDSDGKGPSALALYAAAGSGLYRLNGASWDLIGVMDNTILRLGLFDADNIGPEHQSLYVSGNFTMAPGAVPANHIAKWDGQAWSGLGSGVNNYARAMFSYDDDQEGPRPPGLYLGGAISNAGGMPTSNFARWGCPALVPCLSDLNGDGVTNVADLLAAINSWGPCLCPADIDGNGTVNARDLLILIQQWGPCL